MFEKTEKALWSMKDPRSVRSREALRQAFLELLETTPFDQITMREVAGRADVGYTTIFRHYSTTEEMLHEAAADEMRHLLAWSCTSIDPANTREPCERICSYIHNHRGIWTTLLTGGGASALKEELLRISTRTAARIGPSTDWLPAEVGVILSVSSMIELLAWWLRQPDPLPPERVAEMLDRVIIGPTIRGDFR